MKFSKRLFAAVFTVVFTAVSFMNLASADEGYEKYLHSVTKSLKDMGTNVDVFNANPFQTGTALSGFYLQEKTLLLERDSFFQVKSNKLQTTEDAADYSHRLRVMRAHANNMLLGLIASIDSRNKEGFLKIEKPQQEQDLEKLIKDCDKNADCVVAKLEKPETSVYNVLFDNFALSSQLFTTMPQMQILEVNAVYQLIQLMYLEVFYSQNKLSAAEFDLFLKKQKTLAKQIERSHTMSDQEKKLQILLADNTLMKWKERVLQRKLDHVAEYKKLAASVAEKNSDAVKELSALRAQNAAVIGDLYENQKCVKFKNFRDHRRCKLRNKLNDLVKSAEEGASLFKDAKSKKLPKRFWDEIGDAS